MLLAIVSGTASVFAGSAQSAPGLLERVQAFGARYQRDAPSLVVQEQYRQTVTLRRDMDTRSSGQPNQLTRPEPGTPQHREMTSELVMVRLPGTAGWVVLRDALVVDKRLLRVAKSAC